MRPGLFGKLPAHGDFINRGLEVPLRKALDYWLTSQIGQQPLPAGGLRARLTLGGKPIFAVIVASRDKRGRIFPIASVVQDTGQDLQVINQWCDVTAEMLGEAISDATEADTLIQTLPPAPTGPAGSSQRADILWQRDQAPQPLATALAALNSD